MSKLNHFPDGTLLKKRPDGSDIQRKWSSVFLVLRYQGEQSYYDVYEVWDLKRQHKRNFFVNPTKWGDFWEAFCPDGVVLTNNSRCVMLP